MERVNTAGGQQASKRALIDDSQQTNERMSANGGNRSLELLAKSLYILYLPEKVERVSRDVKKCVCARTD